MKDSYDMRWSRHPGLLDWLTFMAVPRIPGERHKGTVQIEITTIPDTDVFCRGDTVTIEINLRGAASSSLRDFTLKATFPNDNAPVGLEKISDTGYRFRTKVSHLGENTFFVTMYTHEPSGTDDRERIRHIPVATASVRIYVLPARDAVKIESRDFVFLHYPESTISIYVSIHPDVRARDVSLTMGEDCYDTAYLQKVKFPFEEWPIPPKPERVLWEFRLAEEAFKNYNLGDAVPLSIHCNTRTPMDAATPTYIKVEIVNTATSVPIERIYMAPQEEWNDPRNPFSIIVRATTGGTGCNISQIRLSTWSKQHTRRIGPRTESASSGRTSSSAKKDMGTVLPKPHRDRVCSTSIPIHTTALDPNEAESPPITFGDGIETVVADDAVHFGAENDGIAEFCVGPAQIFYLILDGEETRIPVRVFIVDDIPASGGNPSVDTGGEMAEGKEKFGKSMFSLFLKPKKDVKESIEKILAEDNEEARKNLSSVRTIWAQKAAEIVQEGTSVAKKIQVEVDRFKFDGQEEQDFIVVWNPDDLNYIYGSARNGTWVVKSEEWYMRTFFENNGEMKMTSIQLENGTWVDYARKVQYMNYKTRKMEEGVADLVRFMVSIVDQYAWSTIWEYIKNAKNDEEKKKWNKIKEEWKRPSLFLFIPRKLVVEKVATRPTDTLGIGAFEDIGAAIDDEKFSSNKEWAHVIIAHEFGHNLSLGHLEIDETNLMQRALASGNRDLEVEQIAKAIIFWEDNFTKKKRR